MPIETSPSDFDLLSSPDHRRFNPFAVHINYSNLLLSLDRGMLIPKPDAPVYFASGTIDKLSKFLVGHALVGRTNWKTDDYLDINGEKFAETFALAFVNTRQHHLKYERRGHNLITFYIPEDRREAVDLYLSIDNPIPVSVLPIPTTTLQPPQIEILRNQGADLYRTGEFYEDNLPFVLENEEQAGQLYAFSKHQEIRVKRVLLNILASGNP